MKRLLILLPLVFLACGVGQESTAKAPAEEKPASTGLSVPCFGCHNQAKFSDPTAFPHEMHRGMGVHCNQCHIVKAHQSITLNGRTCEGCHELGRIRMTKTSMPAVFDHTNHMAMLECRECHKGLFPMKTGSTKVTMDRISAGKDCGACHNGKKASATNTCGTCHKNA